MQKLNFEWALGRLRRGARVTRRDWNGEMVLYLFCPDQSAYLTEPHILMKREDRTGFWVPSQKDILAEDWMTPIYSPR